MRAIAYPLDRVVLGLVGPGRLRWAGIAVRTRKTEGGQELKRATGSIKVRWGLVPVLALGLLILWGELSPAASTIIPTMR
jgi:hypothetical protein